MMDDYGYEYETSLDDERNAREHRKDNRRPPSRGPMGMVPYGHRRPGRPTGAGRPVVIYQQPPAEAQPQSTGVLGNLTTAEIVELASQVFGAIQPLPGAPTASGDVKIDIENLIAYQGALALHAKRDEQLRTIGSLLSKLISK